MGTYVTVALPEKFKHLFPKSFEILKEVDKKFSKYRPDSYLYNLNLRKKATLDEEFYRLLKISLDIYEETDGYFDISLGNITKKYGSFYIGEDSTSTSKAVGIDSIHIESGYIYLKNQISLDFGGIGKGYAVDKLSSFLEEKGVKNAVIIAGGEIRCFSKCEVGIQNPFGEGIILKIKTKKNHTSISTSGNYQRYIGSKDNNHLINPKNGNSQKNFASITLIGEKNNTYLDAYTTAVSVMPLEKALSFLKKKGIDFIIFTSKGELIKSPHIEQLIVDN